MPSQYQPKRAQSRPRRRNPLPLLTAAAAVCLGLILIPSLGRTPEKPTAAANPSAAVTPTPTAASTPEPTPTLEPIPAAFDSTRPAPATEAVEMSYLADALFIDDSRTDGLHLYGGIREAGFRCYKGSTVSEVDDRTVVELDGGKYTMEQALERGPRYVKIYISLGINELGYFSDEALHQASGDFPKQVKVSQPDTVVYLENLVPVNAKKCAADKQPYYINNDRVAAYNAIFPQLAKKYQIMLLDTTGALTDESGILPADTIVDGVYFAKTWYQKWLAYLMEHTVDADCYAASRTATEGTNET